MNNAQGLAKRLNICTQGVLPLWPNKGSGLFEGPAKDYQMAQFRDITLPLGGILVVILFQLTNFVQYLYPSTLTNSAS